MKNRGSISILLNSKIVLAISVILLIISVTSFSSKIRNETDKEKLESIIEKISINLLKTEYLPGKARLEVELPSVDANYKLAISGSRENRQRVDIKILSQINLKKTLMLNTAAREENFEVQASNPQTVILKKFEKLSIEVF